MSHLRLKRARRELGSSLIEAMVTMLITSIGLLSLSAMQAAGLRHVDSAYMTTQAGQRLADMADRMRANAQGVVNGDYNALVTMPADPACISTGCTPAGIAATDYRAWLHELALALPSGTGAVCLDSTPDDGTPAAPACDNAGSAIAIKIWYDTDRSGTLLRQVLGVVP